MLTCKASPGMSDQFPVELKFYFASQLQNRRKSRYLGSRSIHIKTKRLKQRIRNTVLSSSPKMKYLRMLFHLRFNPHLELTLRKARDSVSNLHSFLRKRAGLSPKTKLTLYKVLIIPILCNGAPTCLLQSFERRILRHCTGLSYNWKTN